MPVPTQYALKKVHNTGVALILVKFSNGEHRIATTNTSMEDRAKFVYLENIGKKVLWADLDSDAGEETHKKPILSWKELQALIKRR